MPDLTLVPMAMCESIYGPFTKQVGEYTIDNLFSERTEPTCTCPAFTYGRYRPCKHIIQAEKEVCGWHEQYSEERQTEEGVCPRCGGKTIGVMVGV